VDATTPDGMTVRLWSTRAFSTGLRGRLSRPHNQKPAARRKDAHQSEQFMPRSPPELALIDGPRRTSSQQPAQGCFDSLEVRPTRAPRGQPARFQPRSASNRSGALSRAARRDPRRVSTRPSYRVPRGSRWSRSTTRATRRRRRRTCLRGGRRGPDEWPRRDDDARRRCRPRC
jgi:hypothetical protein